VDKDGPQLPEAPRGGRHELAVAPGNPSARSFKRPSSSAAPICHRAAGDAASVSLSLREAGHGLSADSLFETGPLGKGPGFQSVQAHEGLQRGASADKGVQPEAMSPQAPSFRGAELQWFAEEHEVLVPARQGSQWAPPLRELKRAPQPRAAGGRRQGPAPPASAMALDLGDWPGAAISPPFSHPGERWQLERTSRAASEGPPHFTKPRKQLALPALEAKPGSMTSMGWSRGLAAQGMHWREPLVLAP